MPFLFAILAVAVLVGCEGPAGPVGPDGAQGPPGPPGSASESVLVEQPLSIAAYNENGQIIIEDSRITPKTFRLLYLKLEFDNQTAFFPLEYLLISGVSISPEAEELGTPVLIIEDGRLAILDPDRGLFGVALLSFMAGATANMVVLVAG